MSVASVVMTKKGQKQKAEKAVVEKDTKTINDADADDEEVNSGFGGYLRSSTGKEHDSSAVISNCFD